MVIFPHCKINIGLQILSRRSDGYHEVATVYYPIPLHDILEVVTAPAMAFHPSGLSIPGKAEDNLCLKAYHLLKHHFLQLPPVNIYLHKVILVGAGLGGGSSDGAFMLQLLNEKYHLGLDTVELQHYAVRLGSDCSFFMQDKPCFATGRGDDLYPFTQEDLGNYHFVLVCPDIHINTAWAYSQVIPKTPARSLIDGVRQPIDRWKNEVTNDFEKPLFKTYPVLAGIKKTLYEQGALYASLSGSGAALYGLFPKEKKPDQLQFDQAKVFVL